MSKKIRINNYTDFESGKSNNGGCYGFWTDYTEMEDGNYEVSYGTTSDLDFCPCCGNFGSCNCSEDDCEIISADKMQEIIDAFVETDDEWIDIKEM